MRLYSLRVAGEEAHPANARHSRRRSQQVREPLLGRHVPAPRVDVLAEQRDLRNPCGCERGDLRQHRLLAAALLHAPGVGHHAVRAALVAAVNHIHEGGHVAASEGGQAVLRLVGRIHRHHLVAVCCSFQKILQSAIQ